MVKAVVDLLSLYLSTTFLLPCCSHALSLPYKAVSFPHLPDFFAEIQRPLAQSRKVVPLCMVYTTPLKAVCYANKQSAPVFTLSVVVRHHFRQQNPSKKVFTAVSNRARKFRYHGTGKCASFRSMTSGSMRIT